MTLIGIVIGIAAVIVVMSAGESLRAMVLGQVEAFGNDVVQVETKIPSKGGGFQSAMAMAQGIQITTLKLSDAQEAARLPHVSDFYAFVIGQGVVSYLDQNKSVNYLGVTPSYIDIDSSEVAQGRFFGQEDDDGLARVTVLGYNVAQKLFSGSDAVGQSIKLGKDKFRVIGVMEQRGGGFGISFDDFIYIPLATAQKKLLGIDHLMSFVVQLDGSGAQDQTAEEIRMILRENHDIDDPDKDDFSVTTMEDARETINKIFGGITLLLVALAAISLLVGGIGIMNIMYVSVTDRTFEIGLRKSIGARQKQILWQFLWEAIVVTIFGGIIGIAIGAGVSFLVSVIAGQLGYEWAFVLPLQSVAISFVFCAAVGLAFGYYPARKAARLDPINALRKE